MDQGLGDRGSPVGVCRPVRQDGEFDNGDSALLPGRAKARPGRAIPEKVPQLVK